MSEDTQTLWIMFYTTQQIKMTSYIGFFIDLISWIDFIIDEHTTGSAILCLVRYMLECINA